jgi:hypothetical protein
MTLMIVGRRHAVNERRFQMYRCAENVISAEQPQSRKCHEVEMCMLLIMLLSEQTTSLAPASSE